jgi:hypothetical protein
MPLPRRFRGIAYGIFVNIAEESDAFPIWFHLIGERKMESFAAIFNDLEDPRSGNFDSIPDVRFGGCGTACGTGSSRCRRWMGLRSYDDGIAGALRILRSACGHRCGPASRTPATRWTTNWLNLLFVGLCAFLCGGETCTHMADLVRSSKSWVSLKRACGAGLTICREEPVHR